MASLTAPATFKSNECRATSRPQRSKLFQSVHLDRHRPTLFLAVAAATATTPNRQDLSTGSCLYDDNSKIFHSQRPSFDLSAIDATDFASFVLSANSSRPPSKVALIDGVSGRQLSYGDVATLVARLAAGLIGRGVEEGDVVMVLSPNSIFYPVVLLAISRAGALAATPNPLGTRDDVRHQVMLTSVKLVIATRDLLYKIEGLGLPVIVIDCDDASSSDRSDRSTETSEESFDFAVLSTILEKDPVGKPEKSRKKRSSLVDPAAVLYSSGTTGMSKAVVLSHANICSQILQLAACQIDPTDPTDPTDPETAAVHLCALPMSHIFGSVVIALRQLYLGNQTVVLRGCELNGMVAAIQRYRISHIYVVPPVVLALAKTLEKNNGHLRYDLSSLRNIFCGAAPLGKELIEMCYKYFPKAFFSQIYGLTEVSGALTLIENSRGELAASVGTMLSNMEAKVIDVNNGEALPPNHKGELLVRGPTTMIGYMNDPQATSCTLNSQGWLRTGDLVYFDEHGNLYVVDRIKELIKYKALQVAPAELEALLISHPQILDAAVIPYKSKDTGEIPMAFVVPSSDGNLTEDQVKAFVAEHVAPYKRVRRVAFTNAIPKTASGKILRKELVKQLF